MTRSAPRALLALFSLVMLFGVAAPAQALELEKIKQLADEVNEHLEHWDLVSARKSMDALLALAPDEPQVKGMLARVRFEDGDYAGAVALYDELGMQGSWAELARDTFKVTKDYDSRESAHFVFRYRKGSKDAALAPYALETLEKQYEALGADLAYVPPQKIRVEVLENAEALSKLSTLTLEAIKTTGTIAICKFNRLMITSPGALVQGYGWEDTLAHEYTHLVVSKKSLNSVPIWIHEGLAKYLESRWRGAPGQALPPSSSAAVAEAAKRNKLISFDRMHPSMALLPSREDAALAFAEVCTAIEYIHRKGGSAYLASLIDHLKAGENYDVAVSKVMGTTFAKFQSDWKAYLTTREYPKDAMLSGESLEDFLKHVVAADAPKLKDEEARAQAEKKKRDEKDDDLHFGDFDEIDNVDARKVAHLGELMRRRNRFPAAVEEFAKAYGKVGARSYTLSNRYAESLMKTGDTKKAEEVLVASVKTMPGLPRTHANLGALFVQTQRPREAERAFLDVVAIDPFDPTPHAELSKIYGNDGDKARQTREIEVLKLLAGQGGSPMSAKGSIAVRSHPLAKVLLDGTDTGKTTPATLEVQPGRHVVKLVNDERGLSKEEVVEIGAGEEKGVEVMFEEAPSGAPVPGAQPKQGGAQ